MIEPATVPCVSGRTVHATNRQASNDVGRDDREAMPPRLAGELR
jgi:hypothetical protein